MGINNCNCRNKDTCPQPNTCQTKCIIYQANIDSDVAGYKQKCYLGSCETTFKDRFGNLTFSFSYFPFVWMSRSRTINNRINNIHKKALRLVHTDKKNLSFDGLLKMDKSVSIHQRILQMLATGIYKVRNDLGPEIMKDMFHFVQKPYNVRNDSILQRERSHTV